MREEHHQQIQEVFSKVSKFLIIIPIVVMMIAFAIGTRDKESDYQQAIKNAQITQTPVKTQVTSSPNTTSTKLNLQGPLVCDYTNADMSAGIFVKSRKIYVQLAQTKQNEEILVRDDCIYRWISGQTTGQKTCGINSYLTLFDTLSSFGMLDVDSLMSSLTQATGRGAAITPPSTSEMVKSCTKKDIPDAQFTVPVTVTFTNTPLTK